MHEKKKYFATQAHFSNVKLNTNTSSIKPLET